MEKITKEQPADLNFKCCFFGAIRGKKESGELVGLVSEVYTHRNDFSHKDFECSFYGSLPKDGSLDNVSLDDPEVWKLGKQDETFERREEIIAQYQNENRAIEYFEVGEGGPC